MVTQMDALVKREKRNFGAKKTRISFFFSLIFSFKNRYSEELFLLTYK